MSGSISESNTKRKPKMKRELKEFIPADYVRPDWDDHYIEFELKRRARGYNGPLRQFLCSGAAVIARQRKQIEELKDDLDNLEHELLEERDT